MNNVTPLHDNPYADMMGDFLDESDSHLRLLNECLLRLDEWAALDDDVPRPPCDSRLLNEMFRAAHSLKGLTAMFGMDDINRLTHRVENVFDAARANQLPVSAAVVENVFQAVDRISAMIDRVRNNDAQEVEYESVLDSIDCLLADAGRTPAPSATVLLEGKPDDSGSAPVPALPEVRSAAVELFAGIIDDTNVEPKYLSIFIDDMERSLDELTEEISCHEEEVLAASSLESLLLICHRIKGSAASIGLHRSAKLAHLMEDVLQRLECGGASPPRLPLAVGEALLWGADALREFVDGLKRGVFQTTGFAEAASMLQALLPGQDRLAVRVASGSAPLAVADLHRLVQLAPAGEPAWALRFELDAELALAGLKATLVESRLAALGTIFSCEPPSAQLEFLDDLRTLTLGVATPASEAVLRRATSLAGVTCAECCPLTQNLSDSSSSTNSSSAMQTTLPPQTSPPTAAPPHRPERAVSEAALPESAPEATGAESAATDGNNRPNETVRVDIERLDHLMTQAGQLVIAKARFARLGQGLRQAATTKQTSQSLHRVLATLASLGEELQAADFQWCPARQDSVRVQVQRMQAELSGVRSDLERFDRSKPLVGELGEAVHQLHRIADSLQKGVMNTRMVPIGPLFGRFKRVVRDITRKNGKDIRLVIGGEKTELDKRVIDELCDPLIHLVRNSADHGIEPPDERLRVGKPPQGTISLNACHRGNRIIIQVSDDGRGLDPVRIRNKAVEKGLVGAEEAEKLSPQQIYQYIWSPGFSTAEKITDISGRGMGMDIVMSKIEELSGSIDLTTEVGRGTTFTIKLPLTLAILPSLMAEIDGEVFAMPVESVVEIVRLSPDQLMTVQGRATVRIRDRILSVSRLSELLEWQHPPREVATAEPGELLLVVLSQEAQAFGLVVHRLLGEEDIVIKSLADNYRIIPGLAGASILGDGRVALILDIGALLEKAITR